MIKEIELEKGVKLIAGENIVNNCTYVSLTFAGGYSIDKKYEISHFVEHILMGFDYMVDGKIQPNEFMGCMRADARTRNHHVEFTFCVTDEAELKQKLEVLKHCFNDVVITKESLEREKVTIIDEHYQEGYSPEDLEYIERRYKKIMPNDIRAHIKNNFTADNLTICTIGKLDEDVLITMFNDFVSSLRLTGNRNTLPPNFSGEIQDVSIGTIKPKCNNLKIVYTTKMTFNSKKARRMVELLYSLLQNYRIGIRKQLRHEKRLIYRSSVPEISYGKQLEITIYCREKNIEAVIEETEKYINSLASNGLTQKDFDLVKLTRIDFLKSRPIHLRADTVRKVLNDFVTNRNSTADLEIQQEFLEIQKSGLDYSKKTEQIDMISSITKEEFNEFIKNFFKNAEISVKIDGNQKDL